MTDKPDAVSESCDGKIPCKLCLRICRDEYQSLLSHIDRLEEKLKFTSTAGIEALQAERDALRAGIEAAHTICMDTVELNMSNYTHEDADQLNRGMIEATLFLAELLEQKQ